MDTLQASFLLTNLKNLETIKARLKETKILNGLTKNLERQRKILI